MLKRITAMLLCAALMVSLVPVQAFTAELPAEEGSAVMEYVAEAVETGQNETAATAAAGSTETESVAGTMAPEETKPTAETTAPKEYV